MDVLSHNREAWNRYVAAGNRWTVPASPEAVARARSGDPGIVLTPTRAVPRDWLGDLRGRRVLALASGGGQQGPLLAAAGAQVTVLDASPAQLAHDRAVAEREGLAIETVEGDMADLRSLPDAGFDLVVNPVSTVFVPDVRRVWREAARVLRPGGALLAGVANPVLFALDARLLERGELVLRNAIPFSDLASTPPEERARRVAAGEPLEFGHSLADLVGGQLEAGLLLAGLYEDGWGGAEPLDRILPAFLATRAVKPAGGAR
ncbi:MAG TPA: class I SAM-dependent methyltransferase [Anaeromyxobacteraceae bacterium]|nr:class I SAM-dependent methyltransferase [Anaeromyxobacteraceae bacterium]